MTPVVRPVFTVYEEEGKVFVSAEIPPVDITERPCFKTAKGRMQGSYIRVGDADKLMTVYEVYSYEAFRKKYRDDIRPVEQVRVQDLDQDRRRNMPCAIIWIRWWKSGQSGFRCRTNRVVPNELIIRWRDDRKGEPVRPASVKGELLLVGYA